MKMEDIHENAVATMYRVTALFEDKRFVYEVDWLACKHDYQEGVVAELRFIIALQRGRAERARVECEALRLEVRALLDKAAEEHVTRDAMVVKLRQQAKQIAQLKDLNAKLLTLQQKDERCQHCSGSSSGLQ